MVNHTGGLGASDARAMWKMAVTSCEKWFHGGFPVAISTNVHPTDQMSADLRARKRPPHTHTLGCRPPRAYHHA